MYLAPFKHRGKITLSCSWLLHDLLQLEVEKVNFLF